LRALAVVGSVWYAAIMPATAQVASGALTGLVRDQQGGVLPGASIAVVNTETNRERRVRSNGAGTYAATGLPPGDYRLDVDLTGFTPISRRGIRVTTGE